MSDDPDPKARYLIQDPIGSGGAGQVFRAWDQHLGRTVAVKRIRPDVEMVANLRREASILAGLNHPNIVTIYDFATDETGPFAVMEYVEGRTLDQAVANGPLSLAAFVELANQICRGLSAAHASGLVHLDLKAGNLMLQFHEDRSFTCKILDFGLAHSRHEAKADDSESEIYGSPYTIAPEQLLREPVDARTDLYSLGCVFYLALSGREPFTGEQVLDVLNRHLHGEATPLHHVAPGVPGPLSHVIMRMMARRPADRPQSVDEVRRLIQGAMRAPSTANRGRPTVPLTGSNPPVAVARPASKGKGGLVLSLVVLLALVGGGFFYFWSTHRSESTPGAAVASATPVPSASAFPVVDPLDAKTLELSNGQTVTMEGVIVAVDESVLFHARVLKFSKTRNDAAELSIADNLLTMEHARSFAGKRVHATGQVVIAANRTRLVVASADDLKTIP